MPIGVPWNRGEHRSPHLARTAVRRQDLIEHRFRERVFHHLCTPRRATVKHLFDREDPAESRPPPPSPPAGPDAASARRPSPSSKTVDERLPTVGAGRSAGVGLASPSTVQPPPHPAEAGIPAPHDHQAFGRSRSPPTPPAGPLPNVVRPVTSPRDRRRAAGTGFSPRSRSSSPAASRLLRRRRAVHAAGPGRLHDRRRDLDGDFVVARSRTKGFNETSSSRDPRRRGDGQDLHPFRVQVTLLPCERATRADGVPRSRRDRVPGGRHRPPQALSRLTRLHRSTARQGKVGGQRTPISWRAGASLRPSCPRALAGHLHRSADRVPANSRSR